jgi:hypothetical protein
MAQSDEPHFPVFTALDCAANCLHVQLRAMKWKPMATKWSAKEKAHIFALVTMATDGSFHPHK